MATFKAPELNFNEEIVDPKVFAYYRRALEWSLFRILSSQFRLVITNQDEFDKLCHRSGISQDDLRRLLSGPGQISLNQLSDLFVAMGIDPCSILREES